MRKLWPCLAVLAGLAIGGAGTKGRAEYPRRTPVVEAVRKTRESIVTVKAVTKNEWGQNRERVGTGVLVDERGYVVTNRHLVAATSSSRVFFADGSELAARVAAEDPATDLAVLRVRPERRLKALPIGPSSDLMVGETVIAVGQPFGYTNTVTTGIVSALGREITLPSGQVLGDLIQTDAGINPGNSGGPLLNINGELIGINVALREGAQSIAFAIDSDTVKRVLSRQLSGLKVAGVRHGLTCSERVLPEGPRRQRVVVDVVNDETPAAAAGLRRGDEIVTVAGRAVSNRFDVERALWDHKPGERIVFSVRREDKERSLAVVLAPGASKTDVTASAEDTGSTAPGKERVASGEDTAHRR